MDPLRLRRTRTLPDSFGRTRDPLVHRLVMVPEGRLPSRLPDDSEDSAAFGLPVGRCFGLDSLVQLLFSSAIGR